MVQPPWERLREKYHHRQTADNPISPYAAHIINREFIRDEEDFPSVQCFAHGFEFLDRNRDADDWLLQIETFDPHEPFFAPERFKEPFQTGWNGPIRDWPRYGRVDELPEEGEELRANYYAIVSLCDFLLGRLLDYFDAHDLWKDTALIVTTDHGFLLGEHDFWAKNRMNMYEEIVHIPLFVHDPRAPQAGRSGRLTQSIDLAPTFLDLFGVTPPPETEGQLAAPGGRPRGGDLRLFRRRRERHRRALHLSPLSRGPARPGDLPVHGDADPPSSAFTPEELAGATLGGPFGFTKQVPLLKVPVIERSPMYDNYGPGACSRATPGSTTWRPIPARRTRCDDPQAEARMIGLMRGLMASNEAPPEAFARLGFRAPVIGGNYARYDTTTIRPNCPAHQRRCGSAAGGAAGRRTWTVWNAYGKRP